MFLIITISNSSNFCRDIEDGITTWQATIFTSSLWVTAIIISASEAPASSSVFGRKAIPVNGP